MNCIRKASSLAICLAFTGCGITKYYDGPARSPDQVAEIRYSYPLQLMNVDGKVASLFASDRFNLLPGSHHLEIRYYSGVATGKSCKIDFDAEAGKAYSVIYFAPSFMKWGAFLRKYANGFSSNENKAPFDSNKDIECKF